MKSRRIQESSSEQGRDAPKIIATEGADFASTSAVSRWVCDKCHAVAFDDFEDASAHEKICKGPGLTKGSGVNIFKGGSGLDLSIDMSVNVESQTKRTPLTKRLTKKSPEKLKSKRLRERSSVGSGKKQLRKKPPRKRRGNQSPKSLDDSNQDQDDEAPMKEIYSKASEDCSFDTSADVNESSSGEDDSSSKDVASTPPRKLPPPNVNGSFVEFHLEPVRPHLICSLCDGYFRDPYTITECLHSFCKSCLFYAFAEGFRSCPKCEISLSPDPKKKVLPDRTLEEVVNTLFPDLKEKDEEDEKAFYEQRGIELQEQYREDTKSALSPGLLVCGSTFQSQMRSQIPVTQMSERKVSGAQLDELTFKLVPHKDSRHERPKRDKNKSRIINDLPCLEKPLLRTSGRLKVAQLKKYLILHLGLNTTPLSGIEILCDGDPIGDELSLVFVERTRFSGDGILILTYRFEEDYGQSLFVS